MSGIYTFSDTAESLDSSAVLVEENIVWDRDDAGDQVVIGYTNASDSILTDTISESFVTADEDNTTQYFSVLETSTETILGDLNITLENPKELEEDTVELSETAPYETGEVVSVNGNDITLFSVPGEGLYGIQIAEDEEGNLQKYQFKVRQNEEGQLEAVTDSIQIVALNDDEHTPEEVPAELPEPVNEDLLVKPQEPPTIFVKQEYNMQNEDTTLPEEPEDSTDGLQINDEETALSFEEHSIETKTGILETHFLSVQKQEVVEASPVASEQLFNELPSEELEEQVATEHMFLNQHETILDNHENVFIHNNQVEDDDAHPLQYQEENTNSTHITNENDSDTTEDYDVVEGLHVTADSETQNVVYDTTNKFVPLKQQLAAKTQNPNTRLIRNAVRNNYIKTMYDSNGVNKSSFFLVRQNEKENVSNLQLVYKYQKPNPRSILKSSFPLLEDNKDVKAAVREEQRPIEKRILKSNKVTTQARMLHNYIAKTTIIHAPVRQERLPRKQTIKPVKRQDEEIIVQEVVVSSNGFIETSEDGVLKSKEPLQPTAFLNVSDSDDDYDPKKTTKRKRRYKKTRSKTAVINIESDESNASDASVIELSDSSDTETDASKHDKSKSSSENSPETNDASVIRKKRGRPPKVKSDEILTDKQEIQCPKCSKSFPSQGSLKTHMQYHNFKESSLRNAATERKFSCKQCQATFKNTTLLNKHLNDHRNLGCTICKKIFSTALELSAHRRLHMKEKMCKSTVAEKHSPKQPQMPRKSAFKSPPKILKCDVCSRTFKDSVKFEIHQKIHKKFRCLNCGTSFISKVVLDVHVRENCVKTKKSPTKACPTLNVRKSFLSSPKSLNDTATSTKKGIFENVTCDQCDANFTSYTNLFKHKVAQHGLETPDKSILQRNARKPLCKPKVEHGGIPSNNRLKSAFASLRNKMAKN